MTTDLSQRLERFFDSVRSGNPFAVNRVNGPSPANVDVADIHAAEFARLTTLARQAHYHNHGVGAMVYGEAGIGKSHLLARLAAWAGDNDQAAFIYLHNLQASPERLPRYVLRCVVSVLTGGRDRRFFDTPLYRTVRAVVDEALQAAGVASRSWGKVKESFDQLIDRLLAENTARAVLLDRTVWHVLLHFYLSANLAHYQGKDEELAGLAVRWLAGEYLDPEEARRLGLRPDPRDSDGVALHDDQHIKLVLYALTQMAWYGKRPFLLCFDQVENLDQDKIAALCRFLHALLDSAGNLLVVTSGVQQTLLRFQEDKVIQTSSWHRIAQEEIALGRISREDARRILEARLGKFMEPFQDLDEVAGRRASDPLFPLGTQWFDRRLHDLFDVHPRQVLSLASDRWSEQQRLLLAQPGDEWLAQWPGPEPIVPPPPPLPPEQLEALIDDKVDQKIAEEKGLRRERPHTLPPSADNLAGLVHSLLQQCVGDSGLPALAGVERREAPRRGQRPAYDLLVRQQTAGRSKEATTAILFLTTASATSAAASLRRLAQDAQPPDHTLLVTDQRQPLPLGASKNAQGRAYLDSLRQSGKTRFEHLELSFDQYAELDALQAVVGLARSGDLEVGLPGGEVCRVSEPQVIASNRRRGRYLAQAVFRDLLSPAEAPPDNGPPGETDLRRFIMAQLALTVGASSQELALRWSDRDRGNGHTPEDVSAHKARLEAVARRMHEEGLLNATPLDDGLFLLAKGK
jgi:hypothetical protein